MKLGDRVLKRGMNGKDVTELQIRLAGFRGTVWDGAFGPGTELQVMTFQRDVMKKARPTGIFDAASLAALERFSDEHVIAFEVLHCKCGTCGGFGAGQYKGKYVSNSYKSEASHRYEYPGIHKAILHAYRAARFYTLKAGYPSPLLTSGYRCWVNNRQKGRQSTNHMGKAIDFDFPLQQREDKRDDCNRCNGARGLLIGKSNFQIGWDAINGKAFEPSNIAPTWIHMDVRCYAPEYLDDRFFVRSIDELDSLQL